MTTSSSAYVASILAVWVFPRWGLGAYIPYLFPLALLIGGLAVSLSREREYAIAVVVGTGGR